MSKQKRKVNRIMAAFLAAIITFTSVTPQNLYAANENVVIETLETVEETEQNAETPTDATPSDAPAEIIQLQEEATTPTLPLTGEIIYSNSFDYSTNIYIDNNHNAYLSGQKVSYSFEEEMNNSVNYKYPYKLSVPDKDVKFIAGIASPYALLLVDEDGELWGQGYYDHYFLGGTYLSYNDSTKYCTDLRPLSEIYEEKGLEYNIPKIKQIEVFGYGVLLLTQDGDIYAYGSMSYIRTDMSTQPVPFKVEMAEKMTKIEAYDDKFIALSESGKIYTAGYSYIGCGYGNGKVCLVNANCLNDLHEKSSLPFPDYEGNIIDVNAGYDTISFLTDKYEMYCTGDSYSYYGNNIQSTTGYFSKPVTGIKVKEIIGSNTSNNAAIGLDGNIYMWGYSVPGSSNYTDYVPIKINLLPTDAVPIRAFNCYEGYHLITSKGTYAYTASNNYGALGVYDAKQKTMTLQFQTECVYSLTEEVKETCTENGYQIYKCENCDNSYEVILVSPGHQYQYDVTNIKGHVTGTKTCSVCQKEENIDFYKRVIENNYDMIISKCDDSFLHIGTGLTCGGFESSTKLQQVNLDMKFKDIDIYSNSPYGFVGIDYEGNLWGMYNSSYSSSYFPFDQQMKKIDANTKFEHVSASYANAALIDEKNELYMIGSATNKNLINLSSTPDYQSFIATRENKTIKDVFCYDYYLYVLYEDGTLAYMYPSRNYSNPDVPNITIKILTDSAIMIVPVNCQARYNDHVIFKSGDNIIVGSFSGSSISSTSGYPAFDKDIKDFIKYNDLLILLGTDGKLYKALSSDTVWTEIPMEQKYYEITKIYDNIFVLGENDKVYSFQYSIGYSPSNTNYLGRDLEIDSDAYKILPMDNGQLHIEFEENITTSPTCTEIGYQDLTCTHCSSVLTEEIPKLGHDYKISNFVQEENIISYTHTCSRCKDIKEITAPSQFLSSSYYGLWMKKCNGSQYYIGSAIGSIPEQTTIQKIENTPNLRYLSNCNYSLIGIDYEGNLWGTGENFALALTPSYQKTTKWVQLTTNINFMRVEGAYGSSLALDDQNNLYYAGHYGGKQFKVNELSKYQEFESTLSNKKIKDFIGYTSDVFTIQYEDGTGATLIFGSGDTSDTISLNIIKWENPIVKFDKNTADGIMVLTDANDKYIASSSVNNDGTVSGVPISKEIGESIKEMEFYDGYYIINKDNKLCKLIYNEETEIYDQFEILDENNTYVDIYYVQGVLIALRHDGYLCSFVQNVQTPNVPYLGRTTTVYEDQLSILPMNNGNIHEEITSEIVKEATCNECGELKTTCNIENKEFIATTPRLNHIYDFETTGRNNTTIKYIKYCTLCNERESEKETEGISYDFTTANHAFLYDCKGELYYFGSAAGIGQLYTTPTKIDLGKSFKVVRINGSGIIGIDYDGNLWEKKVLTNNNSFNIYNYGTKFKNIAVSGNSIYAVDEDNNFYYKNSSSSLTKYNPNTWNTYVTETLKNDIQDIAVNNNYVYIATSEKIHIIECYNTYFEEKAVLDYKVENGFGTKIGNSTNYICFNAYTDDTKTIMKSYLLKQTTATEVASVFKINSKGEREYIEIQQMIRVGRYKYNADYSAYIAIDKDGHLYGSGYYQFFTNKNPETNDWIVIDDVNKYTQLWSNSGSTIKALRADDTICTFGWDFSPFEYENYGRSSITNKPVAIFSQHKNLEYIKTIEATCMTNGYDIYKCTDCQAEIECNWQKGGHDWKELEVIKEDTFGQFGEIKYQCSTCLEEKIESSVDKYTLDPTEWEFTYVDDKLYLSKYIGTKSEITIQPYYYHSTTDTWYHTYLAQSNETAGPFVSSPDTLKKVTFINGVKCEESDASYLFYNNTHIKDIVGFPEATKAQYTFAKSTVALKLTANQLQNIENADYMFAEYNAKTLTVTFGPKLKSAIGMFSNCKQLFVSSKTSQLKLDMSKVESMDTIAKMFQNSSIMELAINSIKWPQFVNDASELFSGCYNLTTGNITVPHALNWNKAFANCSNLTKTPNITVDPNVINYKENIYYNFVEMYSKCTKLKTATVKLQPLIDSTSGGGVSYNSTSSTYGHYMYDDMFEDCNALQEVTIEMCRMPDEIEQITGYYHNIYRVSTPRWMLYSTTLNSSSLGIKNGCGINEYLLIKLADSASTNKYKYTYVPCTYVNGICEKCGSYESYNTNPDEYYYTIENDNVIVTEYNGFDNTVNIPNTLTIDNKEYNVLISNFDYRDYVEELNFGDNVKFASATQQKLVIKNNLQRMNRIPEAVDQTTKITIELNNNIFESQNLLLPDQCNIITRIANTTKTYNTHFYYSCINPYTDENGLYKASNINIAKYTLEKTHTDSDDDHFCNKCGMFVGTAEFPFEFIPDGDNAILTTYVGKKFDSVDMSNIVIPSKVTVGEKTYTVNVDTSQALFLGYELNNVVFEKDINWIYQTVLTYKTVTKYFPYQTHATQNNLFVGTTGLQSLTIGESNLTNFNGFMSIPNNTNTFENLHTLVLPSNAQSIIDLFTSNQYENASATNTTKVVNVYNQKLPNLKGITLPDSITDMRYAFKDINYVDGFEINIPENIVNMDYAFTHTNYYDNKLIIVNDIPLSTTTINYAFQNINFDTTCLSSLKDNENILSMYWTFAGSSITETIELPKNVADIRYLYYDSKLTGDAVIKGSMLQKIDDCVSHTNITSFKLEITEYQEDAKFEESITRKTADEAALNNSNGLGNYKLDSKYVVLDLDDCIINYCTNLKEVTILVPFVKNGILPQVTSISNSQVENVYYDILNLTTMNETFQSCAQLKNISPIPESVTAMTYTFAGANIPDGLVIPRKVNDLTGCFRGTKITTIEEGFLPPAENLILDYTFENCRSLKTCCDIGSNVISMTSTFKDSALSSIGDVNAKMKTASYTFYNTELTSVPKLSNTVQHLDRTFMLCDQLTTVDQLPSSLITMTYSFKDCRNLNSICEIPNTVTNMEQCFYQCYHLKTVNQLPQSLTNMERTFYNSGIETICQIPNKVTDMTETFLGCSNLKVLPNFPTSLTTLDCAFYGCTALEDIPDAFPSKLKDIDRAFYNCQSLTEAPDIPGSVLGNTYATFYGSGLTKTPNVKSGVTSLKETFANCQSLGDCSDTTIASTVINLNSTFISSSITKAPNIESTNANYDKTFCNCSNLTDASKTIKGTVTNAELTFYKCKELTLLPEEMNVSGQMKQTFYECDSLENVPIITYTGTQLFQTFYGCDSLTSVIFDDAKNIVSLDQTFYDCKKLIKVDLKTLPKLQSMTNTFYNCEALEEVSNFDDSTTFTTMTSTFYNCKNLKELPAISSSVEYMNNTNGGVFQNCQTVTQPLPLENFTKLKTMPYAFYGCTNLTGKAFIPAAINNTTLAYTANYAYAYSGVTQAVIDTSVPITKMQGTFTNCFKLKDITFNNITNLTQANIKNVFEIDASLADRLFNENVDGYKMTKVTSNNSASLIKTSQPWLDSNRIVAGVVSDNLNENKTIDYVVGEDLEIAFRLTGDIEGAIWYKAESAMDLTDVEIQYQPATSTTEATYTFTSTQLQDFLNTHQGTGYVILADIRFNDMEGTTYAMVNNTNVSSICAIHESSTIAFNHVNQSDNTIGTLQIAKDTNANNSSPSLITEEEMKEAVKFSNFRICNVKFDDESSLQSQSQLIPYDQYTPSVTLTDTITTANTETTDDKMSILTVTDLAKENDGDIYICYMEAFDGNVQAFLQPVKIQLDVPEVTKLTAEYVGGPIWAGPESQYSKDDVVVIAEYDNGKVVTLGTDQWTESSLLVTKKGENRYHVTFIDEYDREYTTSYKVPGIVLGTLSSQYTGPEIHISEEYDKSKVTVKLSEMYADNTYLQQNKVLTTDQWIESGLVVQVRGDNEFTATYEDEYVFYQDESGQNIYGKTVSPYNVTGYANVVDMKAEYIGDKIFIEGNYNKDDVEVQVLFENENVYETIPSTDWTESSLLVSQKGLNDYTATYKTSEAQYQVPGVVKAQLSVEYIGKPILIGNQYSKDDVIVTLKQFKADDTAYTEDITLTSSDWTESSLVVQNIGDNTFTATYNDEYVIDGVATGDYVVPGVPKITGFTAEYIGEPILIVGDYNKEDVKVIVSYENDTTKELTPDEWTESGLSVTQKGQNTFTATYQDGINVTQEADFEVPGVVNATLQATYSGPDIHVGDDYNKDDVTVVVSQTYKDGTKYCEDKTLLSSEWTESSLQVTTKGQNDYTATYEDEFILNSTATTNYSVNGYVNATSLVAVYNGPDVLVVDDYNKDNVSVTVYYEDGTEKQLSSNEWIESGLSVTQKGLNNFTATYNDLTTTFEVPGVTQAKLIATYKGNSVIIGQDYNKVDVEVVLEQTCKDGTKYCEDITLTTDEWTESSLLVAKLGQNDYTATYEDRYIVSGSIQAPYAVNGRELELTKLIAIYTGSPIVIGNKYLKKDVSVTAIYENGKEVKLNEDEWIESSLDVDNVGDNQYTATYQNLTATYNVTGKDEPVKITATYEGNSILVNENYDKTQVKVIVEYRSGVIKELTPSEWTESGLTVTQIDDNTFVATYGELTTDYVVPGYDTLLSLKATYKGDDIVINQFYDKEDVEVIATYQESGDVKLDAEDWEPSGLQVLIIGDNQFEAKYNNLTAQYTVPGINKAVSITATYNGDDIYVGQDYDKDKVIIVVKYANGDEETLTSDQWAENSLTVENAGDNNFTATYGELTTSYIITGYKEDKLTAVYEGAPVLIGNDYSKDDVKVTIHYTNNTSKELSNDEWTESGLTVEKLGDNSFTATYKDLSTSYTITGYDEIVSLVAIYQGEDVYIGNNYSKDDVKVIVTYTNNRQETLTSDQWTESGLTVEKVGDNDFTATYQDFTATYSITGYKENGLSAKYDGQPVEINKNYNKDDVTVTVYYTNDTSKELTSDQWKESGLTIEKLGENNFTATYKDLTANYSVTGIDGISKITAIYKGEDIYVGQDYSKDDVIVIVTYTDNSEIQLTSDQWKENSLTVEKVGDNEFIATYQNFTATYNITGYKEDYITAVYNGNPVELNKEYSKNDVTVIIYFTNNTSKELASSEWKESGLVVEKVGDNNYTATYKDLTATYVVTGLEKTDTPKTGDNNTPFTYMLMLIGCAYIILQKTKKTKNEK